MLWIGHFIFLKNTTQILSRAHPSRLLQMIFQLSDKERRPEWFADTVGELVLFRCGHDRIVGITADHQNRHRWILLPHLGDGVRTARSAVYNEVKNRGGERGSRLSALRNCASASSPFLVATTRYSCGVYAVIGLPIAG